MRGVLPPTDWKQVMVLSALAVFVRFACARLGAHHSSLTEMSYVVHRHGSVPATAGWVELRLSPAEQARQRQAVLCHATQLLLSKRRFLDFAKETERFLLRTEPRAHEGKGSGLALKVFLPLLRADAWGLALYRSWRTH